MALHKPAESEHIIKNYVSRSSIMQVLYPKEEEERRRPEEGIRCWPVIITCKLSFVIHNTEYIILRPLKKQHQGPDKSENVCGSYIPRRRSTTSDSARKIGLTGSQNPPPTPAKQKLQKEAQYIYLYRQRLS